MRLWHKYLIDVLPRQQLMGQWRECCLIARQINVLGRPNHILVNRIMDYDIKHFIAYGRAIYHEMKRRGYKCDFNKFMRYFPDQEIVESDLSQLFPDWHDSTYLYICYYNLLEKYKCGAIQYEEWVPIEIKTHMRQF